MRSKPYIRAVFSACLTLGGVGCAESDQLLETAAATPLAATERSAAGSDTSMTIAAAQTNGSRATTTASPSASPSAAQPAGSIVLNCKDYATATSGPFVIENNVWGRDGLTGPYSQCAGISQLAADGSVSARWTWSWPSGTSEVKGFPEIIYGQKPGYAPTSPTRLPMQVNGIRTATSKWSTKSTYTGTGQLTFDLWLTRDSARHGCFNCTPITHEIMVAVEPYGGYGLNRNPAWFVEETTIDGQRYKVYKADNFGTIGWRFIVLQSVATRTSGSIDFVPIFSYLKSKKLIVGDEYLSSVEFGTEPNVGTGDVLVQSYTVQVE